MHSTTTNFSSRLACLTLLLLATAPLQAFNGKAHEVVGHIAEAHICDQTGVALAVIDGERDLPKAGLWADEIRSYRHTRFANPWHYINVPDNVSVKEFYTDKRRRRSNDVLFASGQFRWLLANEKADRLDRAMAYRYFVHFVADIHQPLHVGRKNDQGGNRITVKVGKRRTSLHAFWDGYDLRDAVNDPRDYAQYLVQLFADREVETGGEPLDWAQESKGYRDAVYGYGQQRSGKARLLDAAYREKAMDIINLRLYQAGMRLAGELDAVFCRGDVKR